MATGFGFVSWPFLSALFCVSLEWVFALCCWLADRLAAFSPEGFSYDLLAWIYRP